MDEHRDDWHNSVDARLVNLTSAQKSADVDLERIHRELAKLDRILRGDPSRDIQGIVEGLNRLGSEINKFNRIFDKDYLGHGGLVSFITFVYERERERWESKRESRGYKWGFWGMILAAVIGAVALILTNKDQIEKWWKHPHLAPLETKIERAKHPKARHRHVVIREAPTDESDAEP